MKNRQECLYHVEGYSAGLQPLKQLSKTLRSLAGPEHCVFAPSDLAATVHDTVEKEAYWGYLIQVIDEQAIRAIAALK